MDKKSVGEIRKILTKDHCRIDKITGCFVDEDRKVITRLRETFRALQDEELEKYCELFRKTLSGRMGRNLFDMEFSLQEEEAGGKQDLMYRLVRSGLEDEELLQKFFTGIVESLNLDSKYLLLLAHGAYDIPAKTSDGQDLEDGSDDVYLFMIGCICPVAEIREGLCFDESTLRFINKSSDLGVQAPRLGFLFPAFRDRMPDIHSLLYYSRKEEERHPELIDQIAGSDMPVTASAEKELFTDLVETALGRKCDFENVKSITQAVNEMIREDADNPEPLELGKNEVRRILHENGADQSSLSDFDEAFDQMVGTGKALTAENVAGRSVLEIRSPSIKISVKADMADMIRTRILDGREFLVIPVQDDIEVNGIRILTTMTGEQTSAEE